MKNLYEQTDKSLILIKKAIAREFKRLISLAFDEITALTAPKIVTGTYDRLLKVNKKEYKKIADDAIEYALIFLEEWERLYGGTDFFFDREKVLKEVKAEDIVNEVLTEYNPITGYKYDRETERKKARTTEGMVAGRKSNNRPFYINILDRSRNLWYTQSKQYAEDIADQTTIRVWKRAGVKRVMWITARDEKVCDKCYPLDGQIFDIDKAPEQQHYNCRCLKVPLPNTNERAESLLKKIKKIITL